MPVVVGATVEAASVRERLLISIVPPPVGVEVAERERSFPEVKELEEREKAVCVVAPEEMLEVRRFPVRVSTVFEFPRVVFPLTAKSPPTVNNPVPVVMGLLVTVLIERVVAVVKSITGEEPVKLMDVSARTRFPPESMVKSPVEVEIVWAPTN